MVKQRYSVNHYSIDNLLHFLSLGEIAIPEIQRPFVWDSTKVRNLIDSIYRGFPGWVHNHIPQSHRKAQGWRPVRR